MANPNKKWIHRKFGYLCPGKFAIGRNTPTKKRVIRADKRRSKNLLKKYFKDDP